MAFIHKIILSWFAIVSCSIVFWVESDGFSYFWWIILINCYWQLHWKTIAICFPFLTFSSFPQKFAFLKIKEFRGLSRQRLRAGGHSVSLTSCFSLIFQAKTFLNFVIMWVYAPFNSYLCFWLKLIFIVCCLLFCVDLPIFNRSLVDGWPWSRIFSCAWFSQSCGEDFFPDQESGWKIQSHRELPSTPDCLIK